VAFPHKLPAALLALCGVSIVAQLAHGASRQQQAAAGPSVDFSRDIQPILETHCYECHGPRKAKGQLRLDRKASVFSGGTSGPAIAPGDSENSVLVRRLLGLDGEDRMPFDKDPLPESQIATIRRWIDQGAIWPDTAGEPAMTAGAAPAQHWAYARPVRHKPPEVRDSSWIRTPIDRFVLARLEAEGLTPSPEATKEALLRRVSFDLVGLPPTLAEVDAFAADTSPDAYEKVVDRLLASPHYGERWARPWLDLARYADSNGYEKDALRTMWKYRDWVIDALNRDMPFDQFTIEQLAGDMLPSATREQRIATGFHRNTLLNQEGGIDVEEARWETLVDRVNTTGAVWLGTTIGCAQCHNHKYDPFSQRDYYRLLAFFDNVEYEVHGQQGGDHWIAEPELDLPTPEQETKRKALQTEIDAIKAQLDAPGASVDAGQAEWEETMRAAEASWVVLQPHGLRAARGTQLTVQPDGSVLAGGPAPTDETYTIEAVTPSDESLAQPAKGRDSPGPHGIAITGVRLEALPDPSLPQNGPGRDYYGNFVLTGFRVEAGGSLNPTRLNFAQAVADDWTSGQKPDDLLKPPEDGGRTRDMPPGWAIDATKDETRLRRQAVFTLASPVTLEAGTPIVATLSFRGDAVSQALGRLRLSLTSVVDPTLVVSLKPKSWSLVLKDGASRSPIERTLVTNTYRGQAPALAPLRKRMKELEQAIEDLGIVPALVMRERQSYERPSTYLRERGSFLSKGEKLYAGTPRVLPPMTDDQMPNRLGLARWLVSPANPLTARVTVNRAWEQFFGRGLVETSEDFGTQGAAPSHPELLDWLATELIAQKWSLKAIHRLIVTSATYRQSAAGAPALLERDPYNRLFTRGPRFRMEAEMLRDATLAASGLLSPKIGGPSVFPPQPEGIWDNPYSEAKWVTSEGEDRYRRGLYTFIRRTSPYPSLTTFDATSREVCTVRRVRTNTPLQALTMLNDEGFFEAARALAARTIREAGDTPRDRATYAFRLVTSRMPAATEVDWILGSYRKQLAHFRAQPAAASKVLTGAASKPAQSHDGTTEVTDAAGVREHETTSPSRAVRLTASGGQAASANGNGSPQQVLSMSRSDIAERAAWTMVANALLNLDEAVTK